MTLSMRFAAGIAILAVAGGAMACSAPSSGSGATDAPSQKPAPTVTSPSPTVSAIQTPTPTVNLETGLWTEFTSTRYGYSMKYPPEWEAEQASRAWTMDLDRTDWLSPAQDQFIDDDATYQIGVHGFAVDIPSGMTGDDWIDAYFKGPGDASRCTVPTAELPAVTIDGHAGKLTSPEICGDTIAFVVLDRRMYVFTIGRENQEPLFRAFLSTVRFAS